MQKKVYILTIIITTMFRPNQPLIIYKSINIIKIKVKFEIQKITAKRNIVLIKSKIKFHHE